MAQRCLGPNREGSEKRMKFLMLVCVEEDRFENDEEAAAAAAPDAAEPRTAGAFPGSMT